MAAYVDGFGHKMSLLIAVFSKNDNTTTGNFNLLAVVVNNLI